MKLRELLAHHRAFRGRSVLESNLGDGFLFHRNPVFRKIRLSALAHGYRFTTSDPINYSAWSLTSLPDLLRCKKIPYLKNYDAIQRLESMRPDHFFVSDLNFSGPGRNMVMHEAAHAIAHVFHKRVCGGKIDRAPERVQIMGYMLGEALANSVEAMSQLYCQTFCSRIFLSYNIYFHLKREVVAAMVTLADCFGVAALGRLSLLLFLHSNFCFKSLSPSYLAVLLRKAGCRNQIPGSDFHPALETYARAALDLSDRFRTGTTQLFLHALGFEGDVLDLIGFSPMRFLEKNLPIQKMLEDCAELYL